MLAVITDPRSIGIDSPRKIDDAILVTVESCHHGASGGSANAVSAETILEQHAFLGQPINVGRNRRRVTKRPQRRLQVVHRNEQHIGRCSDGYGRGKKPRQRDRPRH